MDSWDSNPRQNGYEPSALTTELESRVDIRHDIKEFAVLRLVNCCLCHGGLIGSRTQTLVTAEVLETSAYASSATKPIKIFHIEYRGAP